MVQERQLSVTAAEVTPVSDRMAPRRVAAHQTRSAVTFPNLTRDRRFPAFGEVTLLRLCRAVGQPVDRPPQPK